VPTAATIAEVVAVLLLVEHVRDPRVPTGTRTTRDLAAGALRDADVAPTPALLSLVLRLVESGRAADGVDVPGDQWPTSRSA
jgi:hypothetical protein